MYKKKTENTEQVPSPRIQFDIRKSTKQFTFVTEPKETLMLSQFI